MPYTMPSKAIFKRVIQLIPGLAIIVYLAYTFNVQAVVETISVANPLFLISSVLIYSFTFLILTLRWKRILSYIGVKIPLLPAYQAFVGGTLLSDVTPSRLGDFFRPYLVKKYMDMRQGLASVAIDRYIDILAILSLSTVGFLLLYIYEILSGETVMYMFLSFSILIFFFLIGTLLLWFKRTQVIYFFTRVIEKAKIKFHFTVLDKLNPFLLKFDEGMSVVKHPLQLLTFSILLTFLAWVTHAIRVSLIAQSVDYTISPLFLVCLLPAISALSLIPISPAGFGLVEGGLVALLSFFGIPPYAGLSIALLDRALTVSFHLLVGSKYISYLTESIE